GISKCETKQQLEEAIEIAASYDERIIVEKAIENAVEVNCAVLGNSDYQEVSSLEYPKSWSSFLSFDEKYIARNNAQANSKKEPKKLSQSVEQQIQEISKKAFKVFDCSGVVRIDFLVDKKQNKIYLNELNSIPGSLAFYLFKDQGYTFEKLITRLIELAKTKMETKLSNKYSYSSNALANFGKGSKMNKYTK
ncbi:MAG: ATP-grasp domain-containing protein, partial [Firmicutes bacterium]|nr:ATP-grasp domain-containing protein [Bacillota bacterium]